MKAADWLQLIATLGLLFGVSGVLVTPRLRRQLSAQTDHIQTERDVLRQRMDLDILKESLVIARSEILELRSRADASDTELVQYKKKHADETEKYERRIGDILNQNYLLRAEVESLRAEVARLRRAAGEDPHT